ncbi:ankyrin repeat domain-containing protein [Wolbachia endosymbiont (group A) of Beris morrisii]|uniref:ankyrin repeat domain-containing protein n=1 Tax=Wolbachia endosymbiont (group A) of Beris morrisii TaxID=3066139 RepID=UPI0033416C18
MPNQEKSQDFELIELLIREAGSNPGASPSTSTQQGGDFESFKARFQSYIDQIPSYLHSVGKEGFFSHFFLGSFSTLIDTEIATKLDIKKIYFNFDDSKTLKVAVIRKGGITNQKSAIEKVNLFVISESDSKSKKFTYGELEEILGQSNLPAQNQHIRSARDDLKVKLVKIVKTTGEISVEVKDDKLDKNTSTVHKFKEIKKGLWSKPESDIAKLTNSDVEKVKEPVENILKKVSKIHSEYKDSLIYADKAREAAHHGFVAGALVNFRYRHNLRVYLEQFAGRGYADIVLVPRGKDRSLNAVPIIIELKAATKEELKELEKGGKVKDGSQTTPAIALEQAKDYAKGFQPNTMRVLTVSDNVLCVGLNLDLTEGEKFSIYVSPRGDREIVPPTIQELLKEASDWNGRKDTTTNVKEKIKQPLERIYHTFPGTPEKGGNYFSRFLLGQLLLANEFERIHLEKSVFLYNEYPLASSTRLGAQSTARPVTTFMLTKGNQGQDKEVFIFHIREGGKGEFSEKKIPIDLSAVSKITEVCISLQEERKSNFFDVEKVNRYNSLNEYKGGKESFNGEWKNIPYPAELKETFDAVLESQLVSSQDRSQSIGKYKELFGKLGEAMLPFKGLIEKEAHTQAVFHGAFSHYSDIKLVESQENRALVLTEFQTGRGKRIDMLVHGIKFANQASSAKEYDPVGLELKGPREGKTANALKDEANKQISDEYTKGVTYKTLTDGKEVDFVGVVFDKGASNADSLILMSKDEFSSVKVVHSSIFSFSQQQPKNKFDPNLCVQQSSRSKRSVNPCLFSKGDVEKFSKGKVDENNVDKIIIDSEKFLTYVKNSRDEAKNAQLVEFVGDKSIEGDRKYLLDKVVADQGYERYVQNERIKDLHGDISQKTSSATKSSKLKGRLMNAAGGIQLIRGIHGAIVSCKDGTATDCGLNLGGIGWSFASQPIENVMVKITPKVVASAEKVVGKIIPGTLGKQTKFAIRVVGVKFGSTIARGTAGAVTGVFDIVDIGMSANNLVDCKKRENSDNPCGEKEIRDNVASISFSGVSFVSGVALTAAGMPVVGIAVGFGLMVGYGIYSGVSNIVEYKKKYDTTHGENWSIFWRTILFQDMASDVQHLADRKNTVDSLAKGVWQALNNGPNSVVAYGIGLGKVSGNTLRPDYATIMMNRTDANAKNLSRVIPSDIEGASRICLPQITNQDYEKGIKSSVKLAVYYCENAMVISHNNRVKMKQEDKTIVYDLQNVNGGAIVGSNVWNNNFLIYSGTAGIASGNNVTNRFVLVNNPSFSGKIIGGNNSTNILDLSQLKDTVIGVNINYCFKPSAHGQLKVKINNRLLIDDYVSNNLFNYHYIGRQSKVDEILCMGYSEHFTGIDNRDVIIDSGGGSNNNEKDIVENCRKVIISPYTTVKGGKSNYTFYVKAADYKGKGLYSEIDVDGTGTIVFPEFDLLSDCGQITYSTESNTLSLKINFGQNNQFTLDIKNYVNQSSNKPHFVLIDKNGSNIVPKIERSDSPTMEIKSFELHSEHSLDNFDDVENHYKKILNNDKSYKVLSVIRGKVQNQSDSVVPHMVFGSLEGDIINFDQGTVFARGGKGNDVYVVGDSIGNKEVKIDNNSDDEKLDMLLMPVVKKDFSIQQCDLHLNYNNTSIQVKNYLQGHNYRHLIVMNDRGEAFIPNIQSMSCSPSSSEKGKLVTFFHATQTQNMFLLPKGFQDDHVVIDSSLEDIEKYKDEDDLLLIRESGIPFIIRIEDFYNRRSKWGDVNFLLWNDGNFSPYLGLQQEVNEVMGYQDKLKNDYEKILKEYSIDFTKSINITHNQDGTLTSVEKDEERIGVVILKDITPDRIRVSSSNTDLVFSDEVSNHIINIKNWDNSESYRISTLEFDLGLEPIIIRRLDRFSLSDIAEIQDLINKASEIYQKKAELELNKQLLTAVKDSDFNEVQGLVNRGANVNAKDKDGKTPLHYASRSIHHLGMVKYLISKGADIDVKDNSGRTPEDEERYTNSDTMRQVFMQAHLDKELLLTVKNEKDLKTINDIIAKDIDDRTHGGFYYTWSGNLGIVEFLVSKDVSVNATDKYGCTLLHWAALKGHSDIAKFLVDKEANVNAKDILGRTPMHFAVMNNHKDIQDVYGRGYTYTTAESNYEEVIQLFLMRGASINEADKNGETPLHLASWGGHLDTLQHLINNGANISTKDSSGKTPLDIARDKGHNNLVQYLQQTQSSLNRELLTVVQGGDLDKVKDFIGKGASLDAKDEYGRTSLYWASWNGNLDAVKYLIGKGASIHAEDKDGKTPLDIAIDQKHDSVAVYLQQTQLGLNKQLLVAVRGNDFNKVKDLVSKGASVDTKDSDGWTLLHHTARRGYLEVAEFLIEKGADINAEDKYGKKPIQRAAEDNNKNIITLLLSKGVNINDTDRNGRTSLYWASYNGNLDAVKYLISQGASIQAGDKGGKTPLDIARDKGYNNIVNYLEEELNKEREKPAQRKRRHHHGDHDRHHIHLSRQPLAIDLSNQPEVAASSSARPSSWINNFFSWVKSSIGGILDSKSSTTAKSPISQIDAPMDVNGTIMLLDMLIRKVTGQKYISTVDQSISPLEAQGYALNITEGFEKVVEQAGLKSGVSMHRLNIDFVEIQKEVTGKIMRGKFDEISGVLNS